MSKGRDLLDFFKSMETPGLPPELTGEELDWVWEGGGGEFLEWLLRSVRPETHLLSKEEADYRGAHSGIPLGEEEHVSEEDILSLEKELHSLEKVEKDLLEVTETYDEMTVDLGSQAASIKSKNERFDKNTDIPVLEAIKNYYGEVDSLAKEVEGIRGDLCDKKTNKNVLISELPLEDLKREGGIFNQLVDDFIERQFQIGIQAKDVNERICYDLVVGRNASEFQNLVTEITRLRSGLKRQEKARILSSARLFGEEKALQFLSSSKAFIQAPPPSPSSLLRSSKQFHDKLTNQLQVDILNASEKTLDPLLDEIAGHHCRQILHLDYQTKLYRQKYTLDRHNALKDILLEQFSLQELFILLIGNELQGLISIQKGLQSVEAHHEAVRSTLLQVKDTADKIKEDLSKTQASEELNSESDPVLFALGKILQVKERLTYKDLASSVNELLSTHQSRRNECMSSSQENARLANMSTSLLSTLNKSLDVKPVPSVSPLLLDEEYASVTSKLRVKMKELEGSFSRFSKDLDREMRSLKEDPHATVQKKLWVNFLNNPKIMEININALLNKIRTS